jgi:ribonuclease VapC
MAVAVLDTSAFLAVFKNEPGADKVVAVLHDCLISSVNAAEVHTKLSDWGLPPDVREQAFALVPATIVDFDAGLARLSGDVRAQTKSLGLSLGDRACLALAIREGLPALTADRGWASANGGAVVTVIR